MGKHHKSAISTFSAQITSTISVALVLLVLGIVAFLGLVANNVTTNIKENIGFVVVLDDDISPANLNALKQKWGKEPYVATQQFISAEEVLQQESERMGEDILNMMADINPYQPEFEITVKPQYACRDSINNIKASLAGINGIDEVLYDTSDIDAINNNINKGILILSIIAAALILISFVLINNTVRLNVFARRFTIHTMKLVGATRSFIRAPFLVQSAFQGVFAAFIAIIVLVGMMFLMRSEFAQLFDIFRLDLLLLVMGIVLASGLVICVTSTYFVVNKLVSLKKAELYY